MMNIRYAFTLIFLTLAIGMAHAAPPKLKLALLKYGGGGDWYANPTSLPNLARFLNKNMNMVLDPDYATVDAGSPEIFNYAFVHMTGHGNIVFSDADARNLRTYLMGGGFLHIDDNYGMDPFVRPAMKKVFPELDFIELPFSHPIFHQTYKFPKGLPKIHQHDGKAPQAFGLFWQGRLVCLYTYECDLGNGWEDQEVHNDPEPVRQEAFKMGANIIQYVFTQ
jgi:hypothetical protein